MSYNSSLGTHSRSQKISCHYIARIYIYIYYLFRYSIYFSIIFGVGYTMVNTYYTHAQNLWVGLKFGLTRTWTWHKMSVQLCIWLVVGPPLWKIWKSMGMISNPILMGKKMATKPPTRYVCCLQKAELLKFYGSMPPVPPLTSVSHPHDLTKNLPRHSKLPHSSR